MRSFSCDRRATRVFCFISKICSLLDAECACDVECVDAECACDVECAAPSCSAVHARRRRCRRSVCFLPVVEKAVVVPPLMFLDDRFFDRWMETTDGTSDDTGACTQNMKGRWRRGGLACEQFC